MATKIGYFLVNSILIIPLIFAQQKEQIYYGLDTTDYIKIGQNWADRPTTAAPTQKPPKEPYLNDETATKKLTKNDYRSNEKPAYQPYFNDRDEHSREENMFMQNILLMHENEIGLKPSSEKIEVLVLVEIESISEISEVHMDITVTWTIRQLWTDYRFNLTETGIHLITVSPILAKKIWKPDLFVEGSQKSYVHKTTTDNMAMRIRGEGLIDFKTKLTTTSLCEMELRWFPLDLTSCAFNMQSFGYFSDEVEIKWHKYQQKDDKLFSNIDLVDALPKYRRIHTGIGYRKINRSEFTSHNDLEYRTKNQLVVVFEFRRYFNSVFFCSYFPAQMMVILAGLSMWVDVNSVPARVGMGVTTILTISTLIQGLKSSLPKVAYLTALDIYLWVCFFFVFSTTCEYSMLNYWMTQHDEELDEKSKNIRKKKSRGERTVPMSSIIDREIDKTHNLDGFLEHARKSQSSVIAQRSGSIWNTNNNNNNNAYSSNASWEDLEQSSSNLRRRATSEMNLSKRTALTQKSRKNVSPIANWFRSVRASSNNLFFRMHEMSHTKESTLRKARRVDKYFRNFYFFLFFTFNFVYWPYLISITRHG